VSSDVNLEPAAVPERLPRGRHNLPIQVVRASQRERLLQAMVECVTNQGYEATTVPQVVATAGVARHSFYALFSDKTDCFIAVCDQVAGDILDAMLATLTDDWLETVHRGTRAYLRWWQEHPGFAQAYLVELPGAGQRAIAARERLHGRFAELFDRLAQWSHEQRPGSPAPRAVTTSFLVPGIEAVVAREVRAGRLAQLDALEDEIVDLIATLLAGVTQPPDRP